MIYHVMVDNKKEAKEILSGRFLKKARLFTRTGNWNFEVYSFESLLNYIDNYYNFYVEV